MTTLAAPNRSASEARENGPPAAPSDACRFCSARAQVSWVDLGMSPLCESFITADGLDAAETFYPLHAYVCQKCWLAQLRQYVSAADIFSEYAYFSSYSDSWLAHARRYCEAMIERFSIGANSQVVEVASNDGYLLQNFVQRGIPCLGIEPAANVARAAEARGVRSVVRFFGQKTARDLVQEGVRADLLLGNNVLAHVPDLNDFVAGLAILLAPKGVLTMEFPHLARLMEGNQFDTIYHEHFCYLSLRVVQRVFAAHGLSLFDVEELPTHGGSLRVYAQHADCHARPVQPQVLAMLQQELDQGFERMETYARFAEQVRETKRAFLEFLISARRSGAKVAGYGAPGKANTFLNYCGIREDLLEYTVDRNPYKHGRFTPGTHIPIFPPDHLAKTRPDFIVILPWNLREEITEQLAYTREWGARLVTAIPRLEIF